VDTSVRHLLSLLVPFGSLGLFLLAAADDSFLFLPIGADLLAVVLIARNHAEYVPCVVAGATGSTLGVFLLDLVCRKGGEAGLKRLVKPAQLYRLKQRMERQAAWALVLACLSPPPFPFGAYIAAASAFQYPRRRLLSIVFVARSARFAIIGLCALYFGRHIIQIANSTQFLWFMGVFIAICLVGSAISLVQWFRRSRTRQI
jgi:membrane protein YqaA with SNARE-associated domain